VNHAAKGGRWPVDFGGGNARLKRAGGWEHRLGILAARKCFAREVGEPFLAAQPMHNFAEQNEIDVAVKPNRMPGPRTAYRLGRGECRIVAAPDRLQIPDRAASRKNASSNYVS